MSLAGRLRQLREKREAREGIALSPQYGSGLTSHVTRAAKGKPEQHPGSSSLKPLEERQARCWRCPLVLVRATERIVAESEHWITCKHSTRRVSRSTSTLSEEYLLGGSAAFIWIFVSRPE